MAVLEIVALALSIVAIVLGIVSIWLSYHSYEKSKDVNNETLKSIGQIENIISFMKDMQNRIIEKSIDYFTGSDREKDDKRDLKDTQKTLSLSAKALTCLHNKGRLSIKNISENIDEDYGSVLITLRKLRLGSYVNESVVKSNEYYLATEVPEDELKELKRLKKEEQNKAPF